MKVLSFALEFRGRGTALPGKPGHRRATTTAPSQRFWTHLGADGIEADLEAAEGETATLDAEVRMTGESTFVESGRIRYGTAGAVAFRTVGVGVRGPSPIPGLVLGAVIWEVTGGEGAFAGARGLITSNFTVNAGGAVVDRHVARLFLPERVRGPRETLPRPAGGEDGRRAGRRRARPSRPASGRPPR